MNGLNFASAASKPWIDPEHTDTFIHRHLFIGISWMAFGPLAVCNYYDTATNDFLYAREYLGKQTLKADAVYFNSEANAGVCTEKNCTYVPNASMTTSTYTPPRPTLRNFITLKPKKHAFYKTNQLASWTNDWISENSGNERAYIETISIVKYLPSVKVPAGTFKNCLVKRTSYGYTSSGRAMRPYYKCKGVGTVKRIDGNGEVRELTKITKG